MSLRTFVKVSEKYIVDNAPTIISGIAVTGTMATAFLTGKATFKAADALREAEEERDSDEGMTRKEQIKLVWPLYIPPAVAVVGTVACIVTANSLSAKRIAAMAALYKLSEDHLEEYRDKVKEKLGLKDERALRDEINQDRIDNSYDAMQAVQVGNPGLDVMFYEAWTGRYFYSTMAKVERAANTLNHNMIRENYATMSDFYELLDLDPTQESSEIGWSLENPVDLTFSVGHSKDGATLVHVMEYSNRPVFIRDYGRMR